MAYSPAPDDRRIFLELAKQGMSARKISRVTGWSRPTVSKCLREAGFDPRRKTPYYGPEDRPPEPSFDYEAEMRLCDLETARIWESLSPEVQERYWEIEEAQQQKRSK
jgi:hypothetical protein